MTDMRAVGFTEFGDPSVLGIVTVPRPSPGPGQVLVKVAAATVNPTDLGFRQGGRPVPDGVEPPYIPGMDLAGVIEETGPDVPGWHAGDRVMAAVAPMVPGGGAQAEYRVVAEDQLAKVPGGWSLIEAATLPMNGLTVRTALDMLALPAGATLAVTGSAGIVGQYAIQLGRHAGLTVIGDAKPEDEALCQSFGAHRVVARGEAMAAAVRELYPDGVDAVLDAALLGPAVLPAVRDGGQLLAVRPYQGPTRGRQGRAGHHRPGSPRRPAPARGPPHRRARRPGRQGRADAAGGRGAARRARPRRRTGGSRPAASAAASC